MKPSNVLWAFSAILWGTAAMGQPVDFGGRFSEISSATWIWAAAILFGGILFRMALDIRTHTLKFSLEYFLPTAAICIACGFLALAATEWYIGKGNSLHPFAQMGIIIAASVNHDIVLGRAKRLLARFLEEKEAKV